MTALPDPATADARTMAPPGPARRLWNRLRPADRPARADTRAAPQAATIRAGLFPWVPVLMSLGIGAWFALPLAPAAPMLAGGVSLALAGLWMARQAPLWAETGRIGWHRADAMRLGGWAALIVAVGFGLADLRSRLVAAPVLGFRYYGAVEGRVIEIDRSARDRYRLTLDRVTLFDVAPARTPETVRVSLMGLAAGTTAKVGQRVMVTAHLGPPPGPASPGSFDFRSMAWFESLGAVGYARTPVMAVAAPEGGIWVMDRARMAVAQGIRDAIGGQSGAVAAALMTGDRSGIDEATNELMRASNLYHIISISGLHMGMLAGFVYGALRLALVGAAAAGMGMRWPIHKVAATGSLVAAAIYLWLSGGGVATERAFVMVAVMLCAILVDRRAISLRSIAIAAVIILIYSPEALTSPGFQMSFAATVALVLCYGPWRRIQPFVPRLLAPVAMLVISSMVAGLSTSPIAAAHFSRIAHYGLLANLLVVPAMGALVMPFGVIAAVLAPVGLAGPALWIMGKGTDWMLFVADWIAGLNGAVSAVPLPPWVVVPLMGFGAVVAVLCWRAGMMREQRLRLVGSALGILMIGAAFAIWAAASRPLILIAPEGEAVGLMTDGGRSLSKPSGGAFVVNTWLLEDGDIASQEEAAARPAWQGDRRDRQADLPGGWRLLHFTGKGAGARAAPECRARTILVANEPVPGLGAAAPCLLFDTARLRRTGAVAISLRDGAPAVRTAAQVAGQAPWAPQSRKEAARRPSVR